ncbi:MAG: hypothetical protein ACU0CY_07455 [Maritimibacter harenae]|jgi:hypothetical protein|uniref:Lipoprotein n=1 Tax=Maritimibacter harenae TaxID=2606218 RepID=A0A845M6X1_9RHOB|nr:hypothetical protein [Maritimibacter harenae]MZR14829.1 hypothetical protein [Maritimibacter harenae]
MITKHAIIALVATMGVAGCQSTVYDGGSPKLIATNVDRTIGDSPGPRDGIAAVAVLPDGCEAWITDDGLEGYGGDRSDPRSGLPRCSNELPRGAVIGEWRASDDLPDYLPR